MKKIIAFICFSLLAVQALPVQHIRVMIFGDNQAEEYNGGAEETGKEGTKPFKAEALCHHNNESVYTASVSSQQYIHFNSRLLIYPEREVLTHPPETV